MEAQAEGMPIEAVNLRLTEQERSVLAGAAQGLTDKESSRRLRISIRTVQTYWQRMKDRTGLTRCQLVMKYGQAHLEERIQALRRRVMILESRLRTVLKNRHRPGRRR